MGSSPCASRCAFMTVRRYLVTVTPGTETGYWKAMNRPIRARSSGSASVMFSPFQMIWPSVTSTTGSRPRRISFSPARTWRFRISRSGIRSLSSRLSRGHAHAGRDRLAAPAARELNQLRERRRLQRADDAALHPGPQELGRTTAPRIGFVGAPHPLGVIVDEALHRGDRALERLDHLVHRDLLRGAR